MKGCQAFMHQSSSLSPLDIRRHYNDHPSPLAMTPEEFYTIGIQVAELAAAYYADRPSKPAYTAPPREALERLRRSPYFDVVRASGSDGNQMVEE
jgi:hypothetical protein